ncbi:MAG: hypothetical protein JWO51_3023 [Rhodospirillales bacterium]|nr:hypothetical protein [Rhodospirillales bacterium]
MTMIGVMADKARPKAEALAGWFYGAPFLEEILFDIILAIDMGSPTFLLGASGGGKTELVRQAARRMQGRYHVAWLEGHPKLDLKQVVDVCRRDFDPGSWRGIVARSKSAETERRPSDNLLIVEHADAVAPRFLEQLVAISNGYEQTIPSHRILMTGGIDLGMLIEVSRLHNNWSAPVVLRLSPWPDEAVAPFLRYRASCAAVPPPEVLTNEIMRQITAAAGGNPRRMLGLARDEFLRVGRLDGAHLDRDPSAAPLISSEGDTKPLVPPARPHGHRRGSSSRWRLGAGMAALAVLVTGGTLAMSGLGRSLAPILISAVADPSTTAAAPPAQSPVEPSKPSAAERPPEPVDPVEDAIPMPSAAVEGEPVPATPPIPSPVEPATAAAPTIEPEPKPVLAAPSATPRPTQAVSPLPPGPATTLSKIEIEAIIERGNVLLRTGDFASARLFYVQAARAGSARAMTAVAWTYDPLVLDHMGIIGNRGEPAKALELYRQAVALGDDSAIEPVRRLSKP